MKIKVKILSGINWKNYDNYCKENLLKKDKFKNLKKFIEEREVK